MIDLSEIEDEAEPEEETTFRLLRKKRQLRKHLRKLKATLPLALNDAFDRYFENQPSAYLRIEEKLDHLVSLFDVLEQQIRVAECNSDLAQVGGRIDFVADRLDEIEAKLYNRPLRRRRGFNFSDFFKHFADRSKRGPSSEGQEIASMSESYQVLGLSADCKLSELLLAFRRLAKKYHPDARGGDRSSEKEFRRVLEAYEMIKSFRNR